MADKLEEDPLAVEREVLLTFAEEEWAEKGNVDPMALVYVKRNPETGERLERGHGVVMIPGVFDSEAGKEMFGLLVRKLGEMGDATAVGMISETYQLRVEALDGETMDEATKRVMALKAAQNGSIKGLPGTIETLMMVWEHRDIEGTQLWMADIMREIPGDESSPGTLGPWVMQEGYTEIEGRFANFLRQAGKTDAN